MAGAPPPASAPSICDDPSIDAAAMLSNGSALFFKGSPGSGLPLLPSTEGCDRP